jgi:hypothetical protein
MGVCPEGTKGKDPGLGLKLCAPLCAVYFNKEAESAVDLLGACFCDCLWTLICFKPDTSNGTLGTGFLPENPGYDPGCLCKCCYPPCAIYMNDPKDTTGQAIACCLELTCCLQFIGLAGFPPCGCIYSMFIWKPKTDNKTDGGGANTVGAPGAPEQQEMM